MGEDGILFNRDKFSELSCTFQIALALFHIHKMIYLQEK